jgi:hypothetical protein
LAKSAGKVAAATAAVGVTSAPAASDSAAESADEAVPTPEEPSSEPEHSQIELPTSDPASEAEVEQEHEHEHEPAEEEQTQEDATVGDDTPADTSVATDSVSVSADDEDIQPSTTGSTVVEVEPSTPVDKASALHYAPDSDPSNAHDDQQTGETEARSEGAKTAGDDLEDLVNMLENSAPHRRQGSVGSIPDDI